MITTPRLTDFLRKALAENIHPDNVQDMPLAFSFDASPRNQTASIVEVIQSWKRYTFLNN